MHLLCALKILILQDQVQREFEEKNTISESLCKQVEDHDEELTAISANLSEREIELQGVKGELVSSNYAVDTQCWQCTI